MEMNSGAASSLSPIGSENKELLNYLNNNYSTHVQSTIRLAADSCNSFAFAPIDRHNKDQSACLAQRAACPVKRAASL